MDRIRRLAWLGVAGAALVVGVVGTPSLLGGAAPATPGEIAEGCIAEMQGVHDLALDRMTTEYLQYAATMMALPVDTPVPRAFKLFSSECKKLDAIARSGTSKIGKVAARCLGTLERTGAAQQLLDDVVTARDAHLDDLALELRGNYQLEAAQRLSEFVQSN